MNFRGRTDLLGTGQLPEPALGPAADGAGEMTGGSGGRTPGKHEFPEGRELRVELGHPSLQQLNRTFGEQSVARQGALAAQVE